jgi:hypothetical protein
MPPQAYDLGRRNRWNGWLALAHLTWRRSSTVHVAETREAAGIYNQLADGVPVAGLFHSTC